jgi:hypothetical protein
MRSSYLKHTIKNTKKFYQKNGKTNKQNLKKEHELDVKKEERSLLFRR